MVLANTVRIRAEFLNTAPSCAKNKKLSGLMEYWSASSENISRKRSRKKGLPAMRYCNFWKCAWITLFIGWALLKPALRQDSWSLTVFLKLIAKKLTFLHTEPEWAKSSQSEKANASQNILKPCAKNSRI